jgi:hypothetical protein
MSGGEESDVLTGKLWWASSDFQERQKRVRGVDRIPYIRWGGRRRNNFKEYHTLNVVYFGKAEALSRAYIAENGTGESDPSFSLSLLKGHGNEPNFPRFLHKSLWPRSLTLHFEPFRFWLRIRGDIHIRKTTPRIGESGSRQDCLEYPFFSNL